jgi:hypothetical protein
MLQIYKLSECWFLPYIIISYNLAHKSVETGISVLSGEAKCKSTLEHLFIMSLAIQ